MIKVFVANDYYLLEEALNNYLAKCSVDPFNITRYNFSDTDPYEIINEAQTVSLLGDEKLVIISNPEFLKSTYTNDHISQKMLELFNNNSQECSIVLLANFPLDYKLEINALLQRVANIEVLADLSGVDLATWINKHVQNEGYQIDNNAINELIARCDGEVLAIKNELNKLMLYHADDQKITYQSVLLLVPRNLEDNIYNLLNAFILNDKRQVLQIYQDFMLMNEDEMRILNAFENKIEEILYTKVLIGQGMKKDDIAAYFRVKPGRAYYMIENAKSISNYDLKKLIERLTDLDLQIKSGKIDKKLGLQLFILGV